MTCGLCNKTDGMCYTSDPPQVRCTITGNYHLYNDNCDIVGAMNMVDRKDLLNKLRGFKHTESCIVAADLIEELQRELDQKAADYEVLAKMYAKVSEDLCVRTKERDDAIDDMEQYGANICAYCKKGLEDSCHIPKDVAPLTCGMFEWRGNLKHKPIIIKYVEDADDSVFIMSNK